MGAEPASPASAEAVGLSAEERAWVERDQALRAEAARIAERIERDPEDIYRTLKQLARAPAERLRLGLRHGRLHPDRRRAPPRP
jgi:hypothetical protein